MPSRKGSRNKKTLVREALMKKVGEQGVDVSKPRSNAAKLSYEDMVLVAQLADQGKTQVDIAQLFHTNQSTISRILASFADTRPIAKKRLHAAALHLADVAVTASEIAGQAGDAEPALELLDRLDVVPSRTRQVDSGPRIVVMVGQPTLQGLPPALAALPTNSVIELPSST